MPDKSVQEIIEDWRDQMSSCEDPATMLTLVRSRDINTIIKYFEDIDASKQ